MSTADPVVFNGWACLPRIRSDLVDPAVTKGDGQYDEMRDESPGHGREWSKATIPRSANNVLPRKWMFPRRDAPTSA
jgi:hypothetical protein